IYYEGQNFIIPYIKTKGHISLAYNQETGSPTNLQIDKVKAKRDTLHIEGKLFTRNSVINGGKIVLKGRENGLELSANSVYFQHHQEKTNKKYGLNRYTYQVTLNLVNLNQRKILSEDVYDLFLE